MVMAVQSVPTSGRVPADLREEALPGYAVAAIREEGRWRCVRLTPDSLLDLDTAITELRAPIFEEKVVDYILTQAKVVDKKVTRDELIKRANDDEQAV